LRAVLLLAAFAALSACTTQAIGPDGRPLPEPYRISAADSSRIQYRVLDAVNAVRQAAGSQPLELNAALNSAAAAHSRDMSIQNRPWHYGADGSTPLDRVARAGYRGQLKGENISETYETEMQTLEAWMQQPDTRNVLLDPEARDLGFSFYQESGGKIWWTLVTGTPAPGA
jgi:uncharacterized protein YkwD